MNKTVLRRYTIEGVEPALLKSPKLLGKGNLNLSALINKLAEAEGRKSGIRRRRQLYRLSDRC